MKQVTDKEKPAAYKVTGKDFTVDFTITYFEASSQKNIGNKEK